MAKLNDIESFRCNYKNNDKVYTRNIIYRLLELHKVYDEIQGYGKMILERNNDESRYLALKYITGCAVVLSKQQDEVIDAYLDNITVKTHFMQMLTFESDLRKFEKGLLTEKEAKGLKARLNNYKKATVNMTAPTNKNSRIGTNILYPLMAIAHNYNPFGKQDEDFGTMIKNYYSCNVDIDVNPAPKTDEEAIAYFKALEKNVNVDNILRSVANDGMLFVEQDEQSDAENDKVLEESITNQDIIWARSKKVVETKKVETKKEQAKSKQIKKQEVKKEDKVALDKAQEYLNYANYVFANSKDFSNVELDKFSYTNTQTLMGKVCGTQEIVPFKDAKTIEQIKEVYNNLDDDLKIVFMQVIYQDEVRASLLKDINGYLSLNEKVQDMVRNVSEQDEGYNTMLNIKLRYNDRQRNKEIKRLVRFSKRDDDYYGLASTREVN